LDGGRQEAPAASAPEIGPLARRYRDRLVQEANLEELINLPAQIRRTRVESLVGSMVRADGLALGQAERDFLVRFIVNEVVGRGPLERLFSDESITEIMVNGPDQVYVERNGRIVPREDIRFADEAHVLHIIDRLVSPLGRRVDESNPMVDARTPEGDRINAVIPPLSLNGPVLTIRRFHKGFLTGEALVRNATLTPNMLDFLRACVVAKLNLVVSGGTGSGKTTLLNVLASYVPNGERIVTVEDSAELQIHHQHSHVLRLEARPANVEGSGEVTIRQLVINALRMRPDRIIVGEVRGAEALDMLQAMNTGHEGSMTTLHANSPQEAFSRLETMVMWAPGASQLPLSAVREHLVAALNIVVQEERLPDGSRKVVEISEVQGVRKGQVIVKPVFVFERHGVDAGTGEVLGSFTPTGHLPKCLAKIRAAGIQELDPAIFQPEYLMAELGEDLLTSDDVTEIMVNGPLEVYVERAGKLQRRKDLKFRDEAHLRSVIDAIVAPLGRRLDEAHPWVDARLPDGSRVNAALPPVALNGPVLTIRRFPQRRLAVEELVEAGSLTEGIVTYLQACVHCKLNLLVSGGTGSGKTTLLNVLSRFIPVGERVVTIEDVAELQLQQAHVVRMEARPADEFGEGEIRIRDLMVNALRMRPDRVIVGEVRGAEALDMLQAMNTGHPGSMTTIHANDVEDAFSRLQTAALWAETGLRPESVLEQIASAIHVVLQVERLPDGSRKVVRVAEVEGLQNGLIRTRTVFEFRRERIETDGAVVGAFVPTGKASQHLERFATFGQRVPEGIFRGGR
jgi:pilus assembly protein CpaF